MLERGLFCLVHFQVTPPPPFAARTASITQTDWADLQACPSDPRASCSLSTSHNATGITETGEVWEPTRGVHPGYSEGGGEEEEGVGRCRGREGLGGGSWGPPFQFHSVLPNERKGREWCPLSSCQTGTFKKQPQCFLKWGVFLRDKKRGKEWVGEEFNCGAVWGDASGRMATLVFIKERDGLLVLPLCVSLAPWNVRWAGAEQLHYWSFTGRN